jgi:hypothetical protein
MPGSLSSLFKKENKIRIRVKTTRVSSPRRHREDETSSSSLIPGAGKLSGSIHVPESSAYYYYLLHSSSWIVFFQNWKYFVIIVIKVACM